MPMDRRTDRYTDIQTDITELRVAFCKLGKAPKNKSVTVVFFQVRHILVCFRER